MRWFKLTCVFSPILYNICVLLSIVATDFLQSNDNFFLFYDPPFVSTAAILHSKRLPSVLSVDRDAAQLNAVCNLDVFQCKAVPWTSKLLHAVEATCPGDLCTLSSEPLQHHFDSACKNYRIASWRCVLEVDDGRFSFSRFVVPESVVALVISTLV